MRRALVVVACLLATSLGAQAIKPPRPLASPTAADLDRGHALFDVQCARCHGIGGTGGMGPPLAGVKLRRARDEEGLITVISEGVPGTAMSGTWQLSERELAQVAAYVTSLGRVPAVALPGDPLRGKAVYDGKGACASCHIVGGVGSGGGPELTDVGNRRGADYLRESLLEPGARFPERRVPYEPNLYPAYVVVRAVALDGTAIVGTPVNEDSFTVQVRDAAGRLHSLRKAGLARLETQEATSLMPSYRGALSAAEVDDVVAYLATLRGEP